MTNKCNCPDCQHYRRIIEARRARSAHGGKDTAWAVTMMVLMVGACMMMYFAPEITGWWEALR
jgi:uncharacterized paraquat-inducible protein A